MMELPGSRIPWLRAVGAAGAVAALVVGGAVTTAGAIDSPDGAEPATVQVMATDADGNWFSCDIEADLDTGPAGEGVAMAISAAAPVGSPEGAPDGARYNMVVGAIATAGGGTNGPVEAPEGAIEVEPGEGGAIAVTGEAVPPAEGAVVAVGPMTADPEEGMIVELPEPSEVRPGTPAECDGLNVTVGETALPTPGAPAGPAAGVTGASAVGGGEEQKD